MSMIWRDLRVAVRTMTQAPAFFLAAVLALALGIGPNTAIFSLVYATLLAPLPYPDGHQLVMVWSSVRGGRNPVSAGDYLEWKAQAKSFQYLEAFSPREVTVASDGSGGGAGEPERIRIRFTAPDGHRQLGEGMFLGRDFLPEENQPGKDQVVLISHRVWRQRYDADPNIIGRQIRLDSKPYTIVGVLPPGASDRLPAQMWGALAFKPAQINHDVRWLMVKGRLKPGVTVEQAQQEMNIITGGLAGRLPRSNEGWGAIVSPLQNDFLPDTTKANLWLLLAAVSFVVLIACVNVANLLLARGTARDREIAVRAALGATRAHLFRQVITESLVLAAIGGTLGVLSSVWILRGVLALLPPFTLPSEADPRLSVPVLLFTLGATIVSGLLFGSAPAWQAARVDLNDTLKQAGRSNVAAGRRRLRNGLVLIEFALAVTLLAAAGLTIQSFWNRTSIDLGVQTERILTFSLPTQPGRLATPEQIDLFYRQVLDKLRTAPGVTHAAAGTGLPFTGRGFAARIAVVGQAPEPTAAQSTAALQMATPDYFQTFGIRMLSGRSFDDTDAAGSTRVAVVNERFAQRYLAGLDPLRQRVTVEQPVPGAQGIGTPVDVEIVGVYRNVANGDQFGDPERPEIYVPFWQTPWPQAQIAVRTTVDPETMQRSLGALVRTIDPELPLANVKTMERIVGERLAFDRLYIGLYGGLAVLALVLAALGIYGVMAFLVAQRTQEIGLRMALGAEQHQVLTQVLGEGLKLAVGGLVLGVAGAYAAGRAMQSMLYETGALNPLMLGVVGLILIAAALAACYLPARRASVVDPLVALRQ